MLSRAENSDTMKAARFVKHGSPKEALEITTVPTPAPRAGQVLVRVIATAINNSDWSPVRGKPYLYRPLFDWLLPKVEIPGMELAGIMQSVASGVTTFTAGGTVFGDISEHGFGTLAKYVSVDANALLKKPVGLSFEEAREIPHALGLAAQALQDLGKLTRERKSESMAESEE
jgi:NADPH:quinone reductase-like Zn-dependent oxidoreductase